MAEEARIDQINLQLDSSNLYTETSFTDMKTGAIRVLSPVTTSGEADTSRSKVYIGSTQLMTPEGPLPVQTRLPANNLEEAIESFADAMHQAVAQMMGELKKMAQQAQADQKREDSRIIIPK